MPEPEFFTLKVLAGVSSCWSGTAGLYRPGNLLDSMNNWNGEFSLAVGSPTIREGGYTASACWMWGRCPLAMAGSLLENLLRSDWPSAHPGSLEYWN